MAERTVLLDATMSEPVMLCQQDHAAIAARR